ncbi:unnamed protein product [Mytilus coruscus]|uniref:Uncharacterized protein n=1 Tax=Mytilus coruscus TaxID=42192 RepID=A0A6J8C428_MYTCO|nr:unnamed protein product [Mytilus coruscus]
MINGREYLVKDNGVVPVDFESTGVVQHDTKWGDCLHQFLEIKHGKKISQLTLVTNFMSNQEYFTRYKGKIFGVSGTLGTEKEKSFLKRQFTLRCQNIPTHRSKVFKEVPGIICNTKSEWLLTIQDIVRGQVTKASNKGQRAVLVICEDINTAEELKNILTEKVHASVALYTRNDENNDKIDNKLKAGDVIVSTNIADRGTDIDIEESVEKAGGLFVLVTFLPQNTRIENQVFGRSARKGQPGSAQIVLNRYSLPLCFSLHEFTYIKPLKQLRDEIEKQRIADIEEHAFKEVQIKEELFKQYCSFLLEIKEHLNFKDVDEKIMLDSLHEYWGMWLKMNCDTIANCQQPEYLNRLLDATLKTAKNKLMERTSPCSNISHIIKFANEQLFDKNYDSSLKLFKRAIDIDSKWAAIAYYNRAYCSLLKRGENYIDEAIDDLSKSQECFNLFKDEAFLCFTLSSNMKDKSNNEHDIKGFTSEYEMNVTASQFSSRCQIINHFDENIKVSLQQLRELQNANKEATAEYSSIFTIALGDDSTSKKIETGLYIFWEMGLTELIYVKERIPFCRKGILVVALGVLQIAVGTLIIASTTGLLTQLGWGLIAEGVNDICTGAYAVWKRDQEFMKSWMIGKAASIAISFATFGYSQVKEAAKGARGIKASFSAVQEHCITSVEKFISEIKAMGSMITSKSFGPVLKTTCVKVGQGVGTQLAKRCGKYLLEVVQEKVMTHFEDIAKESIKKEVQLAFNDQHGEMYPMIDDYIYLHCKRNTPSNEICAIYMRIAKTLLCSKNILRFRQVLLGCVKDVIKTTSQQMKSEQNQIFEQCKPIFNIVNGLSYASYNVKELVSFYCEEVKTLLKKIYKDSLNNKDFRKDEEEDPTLCTIRQQIIDKTAEFLYSLLKESFEFTGTGKLEEKLQAEVGNFVSEYGGENNIGKETIAKIIAISSKAGQIGKDLATKGTIDVKAVIDTGLDATEVVVDEWQMKILKRL